jgi:hypothetical protein
VIRLNTPLIKSIMLILHIAAIPVGIATGIWLFDTLST